jgi:inhibitor of KinA sporulation pathway (predicted exonuclease)
MVENESDFSSVFADFQTWIEDQAGSGRFTLVTCGDWDLKTMLPKQCSLSGLDIPDYLREWINIKKSYHAAKRVFPRSLPAMLAGLGMTFEGRQHCGMDDTVNIVRILTALGRQGHVFANTTSRRN